MNSRDGDGDSRLSTGNHYQHESQMRLRGRMPTQRARSIRGLTDPRTPVQGVLPRDKPSRYLSDDSISVAIRQRKAPSRAISTDDLWSSRHGGTEPRRGSRRPHVTGSRSFSPPPSQIIDSTHKPKNEFRSKGESKASLHGTVNTVAATDSEGSSHPTELLHTSSSSSFDGSGGCVAHRIPETTLVDAKKKIAESKATKSTDIFAGAIVAFMQESHHSIILFCLDTVAEEAFENQAMVLALIGHSVCKQVFKIITRHLGDEKMMSSAFAALRVLTTHSEARIALVQLSLSKQVVEAMQCNSRNATIQGDGCAILSNLAVDAVNAKVEPVDQSVILVVLEAMTQHKNDETVVSSACFAYKNLTYEESNLRSMSRTEGLLDSLQAALKQFASIFEAHETLDRIYLALAEDASLEESIVAMLQAEATFADDQGPETIVNLLDTLKMYSWSRDVAAQCLTMLAELTMSSETNKAKLLANISLHQLRACVDACGNAKSIESELAVIIDLFDPKST